MSRPMILKTPVALCFVILLLACNSVMAQSRQKAQPLSPQESSSPQTFECVPEQDFFFGTGPTFFRFCVSKHGNIVYLFSPAAYLHLVGEEGYVACGTGASNAYDAGMVEAGWGESNISQPGGSLTLPLIITRQSLDGNFELKQTIDSNRNEKEILITMELKNISAGQLTNVKLARYFNGDISRYLVGSAPPDNTDDIYDRDSDSVWGKDNGAGPGHHSLTLATLTFGQSHSAAVETYADWSATKSTCTPVAASVPTSPGDYTGRLTYNLGTLNAGASRIVKFIYRRS